MFKSIEQEPPIRQVRQRIVQRGPMQLRLEVLADGDVLDTQDPPDERATVVVQK